MAIILFIFSILYLTFKVIKENPLVVYNLNLNVHCNSNSTNIFKMIFKGLLCTSNINLDISAPELNLLINPKNLMLSKSLMENIIVGDFKNYNILNKRFKSKIIYKDKVYKTKIKFHGKNPTTQHIKGQFFSMDVKILDGKAINGLTSFDLILKDRLNPRSLFIPFVSSNKLMYQNTNLFKIKINSSEWQYFYMQPNRDEKFFYNYGLNIFLPNLKENPFQNNRGFVFEKKFKSLKENNEIFENFEDKAQKKSIAVKYNELNSYISGDLNVKIIKRFFDTEYLSNFLAVFLLLGCDPHGNSDGNFLVGFNSDNGKFYPVLHRDYNSRYINNKVLNECLKNKKFITKLINNSFLKKKIFSSLNEIDNDITKLKDKYKQELKKYYLTTLIGSYTYHFQKKIFLNDLEIFTNNMNFLKRNFFKENIKPIKETNITVFNEEKFRNSISESNINFEVNDKNKIITIFGKNFIKNNIDFPSEFSVLVKDSTSIIFKKKAYLKFYKNLTIEGTKNKPIKIFGNFKGTLIVSDLFHKHNKLVINNAYIEKLTETVYDGVRYTGGITVLSKSNVNVQNSTFIEFLSEDMINLKGYNALSATIFKNKFHKVINDGIDLDFVKKSIIYDNEISANLKTVNENSDGLDFSKTNFFMSNNKIQNFQDKCLSVGEKSEGSIEKNFFLNCNIAVANKDGSIINLSNNIFQNNKRNITSYIKKKSYTKPIVNYVK